MVLEGLWDAAAGNAGGWLQLELSLSHTWADTQLRFQGLQHAALQALLRAEGIPPQHVSDTALGVTLVTTCTR